MLRSKQPLDRPLGGERTDELRRLETLWETPTAPEPELALDGRGRAGGVADQMFRRLGWLLAVAWAAFLATALLLAPASQEPLESAPLWVEYLVVGLWLALPLATIGGLARSPWLGYGASLAASGMAVALSIACNTTGHHTGSWWFYELVGSLALAGLSVAGLWRARRAARES